jgi:hypothetical protein
MNKHLIAAGALTLAVAGGSAGAVAAQSTPPEIEFDVTAKAVKIAAGTQIPAGVAKLTFDRTGKGETGLALVRLNAGVTVEQFGAQVPKLRDPSGVHKYGRIVASTFVAGNDEYSTTVKLDDADYVFVDMTEKPATRLSFHAGPGDSGAVAPAADASVSLRDYRFVMPASLKAGKQTLRVANKGDVMHHALVFPLAKGVNGAKLMKKIKAGKEPRKEFAGPPSALVEVVSPATTNDVEVNLRKGKYLFVCFLQDSPKSKMHAQMGMQKVVTVK